VRFWEARFGFCGGVSILGELVKNHAAKSWRQGIDSLFLKKQILCTVGLEAGFDKHFKSLDVSGEGLKTLNSFTRSTRQIKAQEHKLGHNEPAPTSASSTGCLL
jgi:hypothetical protein